MGVLDTQIGSGHDAFKLTALFWLDKKGSQTLQQNKIFSFLGSRCLIYEMSCKNVHCFLNVFISKSKQNLILTNGIK